MRDTMEHRTSARMALTCAAALWAVLLQTGVAFAETVDERRTVTANPRVSIENVNGTVTVEGWDRKEVHVTGTIGSDVEKVDVDGTEARLHIEVILPRHGRNLRSEADLLIKVPVKAEVTVEVVNCPIDVSKVDGTLDLESVNGDITVVGKPARVSARAVNGHIQVTAPCTDTRAETVSGRIVLDGVSGELVAATVGGSVEVHGSKFESAECRSVSGDIDFDGDPEGTGDFEFEAHSGDVILHVSPDISAEFDITTFSGDIDSAFGQTPRRKSEYVPGRELSFSLGSGNARISISSFSGDVSVMKKMKK